VREGAVWENDLALYSGGGRGGKKQPGTGGDIRIIARCCSYLGKKGCPTSAVRQVVKTKKSEVPWEKDQGRAMRAYTLKKGPGGKTGSNSEQEGGEQYSTWGGKKRMGGGGGGGGGVWVELWQTQEKTTGGGATK